MPTIDNRYIPIFSASRVMTKCQKLSQHSVYVNIALEPRVSARHIIVKLSSTSPGLLWHGTSSMRRARRLTSKRGTIYRLSVVVCRRAYKLRCTISIPLVWLYRHVRNFALVIMYRGHRRRIKLRANWLGLMSIISAPRDICDDIAIREADTICWASVYTLTRHTRLSDVPFNGHVTITTNPTDYLPD